MSNENEIILNGKTYILKNHQSENYAIVRGDRSGVFAGNIKEDSENGREIILQNCRRLWYWSGAASISQIAKEGVKNPDSCKFTCEVSEIRIKDVIEVIPTTEKAEANIKAVPVWEIQ